MVFGCRPSAARPRPTPAAGTPASTCSTARSRRISRVWWSSLRPSLSLTTASVTAPDLGVKLPAIPLVDGYPRTAYRSDTLRKETNGGKEIRSLRRAGSTEVLNDDCAALI